MIYLVLVSGYANLFFLFFGTLSAVEVFREPLELVTHLPMVIRVRVPWGRSCRDIVNHWNSYVNSNTLTDVYKINTNPAEVFSKCRKLTSLRQVGNSLSLLLDLAISPPLGKISLSRSIPSLFLGGNHHYFVKRHHFEKGTIKSSP